MIAILLAELGAIIGGDKTDLHDLQPGIYVSSEFFHYVGTSEILIIYS